ncbi:MAG: zinc-ribbon domain-containing protein [Candidatus Hodarchaeota archaeon]
MLKYNTIKEGIIKEFLIIKPSSVSFVLEDLDGQSNNCYLSRSKPNLDKLDDIYLVGSYTSKDHLEVNYLFNKTKNYGEKFLKVKGKGMNYLLLFMSIFLSFASIFFLLSYFGIIPIQINPPYHYIEEIHYILFNMIFIIPFCAFSFVFWTLSYNLLIKRKQESEIVKEMKRIKQKGFKPSKVIPKIKEPAIEETVEKKEVFKEIKVCSNCGEEVPIDAEFCSKCGEEI